MNTARHELTTVTLTWPVSKFMIQQLYQRCILKSPSLISLMASVDINLIKRHVYLLTSSNMTFECKLSPFVDSLQALKALFCFKWQQLAKQTAKQTDEKVCFIIYTQKMIYMCVCVTCQNPTFAKTQEMFYMLEILLFLPLHSKGD